jgi:hypothetical protein
MGVKALKNIALTVTAVFTLAFSLAASAQAQRVITFAERAWEVKRCDSPCGPGPNFFSDAESDVWVDASGLHLTISQHAGNWYVSEVILMENLGYGTYAFYTRGRVDVLDPCAVAGFFTWDTGAPPNYRELDFELSRWCDPGDSTNAQYVVQPFSTPGNLVRYPVELGDTDSDLTQIMEWQPGRVRFWTYRGHHDLTAIPPTSDLVYTWNNDGPDVPTPGNENVRINFWLYTATPPAAAQELLITDFQYSPDPVCGSPVGCATPSKSVISLRDSSSPGADKLRWKWQGAEGTQEFGDPVDGTTSYRFCVFDGTDFVFGASLTAGGLCNGEPCWQPTGNTTNGGYRYRNRTGNTGGITGMTLKTANGKASLSLQARGMNLSLPGPVAADRYFTQTPAVTAQIVSSDGTGCWQAIFPTSRKNTAGRFAATVKAP